MTDHDAPTGPLARLRAQVVGPRGYRRIDALVTADDPEAAVAALSPNEVYELVHEVGFEDGQDLIALATPSQIQGCFDLDGWNKDQLDLAPLKPWLQALLEAGFEKVGQVWGSLDSELRALILQRHTKIYDTTLEEAPEEDNEAPIMVTPDRFFLIELLGDDDTGRVVQAIVEDLYRADPDLARHTIMSARSEPPAELEEQSYRWRSGRLADLGYVDFYDALDLFRPLPAAQVHIGEGSQERLVADDSARMALAVAQEVLGRSFLARTMATIEDVTEAERLESAFMVLVNKVLSAGRAKPGQEEVVRRGALYAPRPVPRARCGVTQRPRAGAARQGSRRSAWRACSASATRHPQDRPARAGPRAALADRRLPARELAPARARRAPCSRAPPTSRRTPGSARSSRRPICDAPARS